jgi:HSP20 family protein
MNQIASNGSPSSLETATGPTFVPPADVIERGDAVIMLLDLPGADPATLNVTLEKRVLMT